MYRNTIKGFGLLIAALLILTATGCEKLPEIPGGGTDLSKIEIILPEFPGTLTAEIPGMTDRRIKLVDTNLGEELGDSIVMSSITSLRNSGLAPYLPVLRENLYDSANRPYLTFTFDKEIAKVFESSDSNSGIGILDSYIFSADRVPMKLREISISGATVTFYLPEIMHEIGPDAVGNDYEVFMDGSRYFVEFFVQTTDKQYGRVTIPFVVRESLAALGNMGPLSIAGKAADSPYSTYLIDSDKVFPLSKSYDVDHDTPPMDGETVKVEGQAITIFNTYASRYGNGQGYVDRVYDSLDAIEAYNAVLSEVAVSWAPVTGAAGYYVYTTADPERRSGWVYLGDVAVDAEVEESGGSYGFGVDISSYPIAGHRYVRVVPYSSVLVGGHSEIRLEDEVHPVTDTLDLDNTADYFNVENASSAERNFTGHQHSNAGSEGEVICLGTVDLTAPLIRSAYTNEAIRVSSVSGSFTAQYDSTNESVAGGGLMPINAFHLSDLPEEAITAGLGTNVLGVVSGNSLSVFIRVRCYVSNENDTLSYHNGNTTVKCDSLRVTYTDLSGNALISRDENQDSKNSGVVIWADTL